MKRVVKKNAEPFGLAPDSSCQLADYAFTASGSQIFMCGFLGHQEKAEHEAYRGGTAIG